MRRLATDWLDWSGRTGRLHYAIFTLGGLALFGLAGALADSGATESLRAWVIAGLAILVFPWVGFNIRRLHDIGRGGAWTLALILPVIGFFGTFYLLLARSRDSAWRPAPRALVRLGFLATCVLALLFASRLLWSPYWLPSGSMKPGLLVGDYLVTTRFYDQPQRGEVVVFRHPDQRAEFIKRIIGLPGDKVQMRDGIVYLNDTPVPQQPAGDFTEAMARQGPFNSLPHCVNRDVEPGGPCRKERLAETLPGRAPHHVLNIRDGFLDNTPVFTVPDDHIFVLGDNRDNSADSRMATPSGGIGMVPIANISARARWILFSFDGPSAAFVWDWRPGRFLVAVK